MNSAPIFVDRFRRRIRLSYTETIMTDAHDGASRQLRCHQGGNSLGLSRLSMAEVQMCGIPKLSVGEVASTP